MWCNIYGVYLFDIHVYIVSDDPDIDDKQVVYFGHKIFLEKCLIILKYSITEHSEIFEKNPEFSRNFFFMPIEAFSKFWNKVEKMRKTYETLPNK